MRLTALAALALMAACAAPVAIDIRGTLTRAQIDGSPQPLLLAEVPGNAVAATLIPLGSRDGMDTWRTAGNQTLSFRDGVLIATRGLGDDLMSADVSGTLAALNGAAGDYARHQTYLDGDGQTVFRSLLCSMDAGRPATVDSFGVTFPTTLRVETCHTTGLSIENRYWTDAGRMRRAEQWIGPALGPLVTERLSR